MVFSKKIKKLILNLHKALKMKKIKNFKISTENGTSALIAHKKRKMCKNELLKMLVK